MSHHSIAITIFLYNRPTKAIQILSQLKGINKELQLPIIIFVDGGKNTKDCFLVHEVQNIVKQYKDMLYLKYIFSDENKGLGASIIAGVTEVLAEYDSVMVFEDDLVFDINCINYFLDGLKQFQSDDRVFSISGHSNPLNKYSRNIEKDYFFCHRPTTWGWATWSNRWSKIKWDKESFIGLSSNDIKSLNSMGFDIKYWLKNYIDGKVDSWGIRWTVFHILNDVYALYPKKSYIKNDGFGADSTNTKGFGAAAYSVDSVSQYIEIPVEIEFSENIESQYLNKFKTVSYRIYVYIRDLTVYKLLKKSILKILK